jgi:hypothetical protein
MFTQKSRMILFLCAVLIFSFIFGGCSVKEGSEESKALCEAMLDHLIADDYESAYKMAEAVATEEEFERVWTTMREVLKDSSTYELQQKSWYQNWSNGLTTTEVLFEIITDDGKIFQMLIYTRSDIEGIAGLNFQDSTAFAKKTESLQIVGIFLAIFSLGCLVFTVWMFVDCLKRCKTRKVLWAILTLCSAGFSVTLGSSSLSFNIRFAILAGMTSVSADRATLAVTFTVLLPIGALIYCLMRKRLTRSMEKVPESIIEESEDSEISEESKTQE